jgi:pectate lyase
MHARSLRHVLTHDRASEQQALPASHDAEQSVRKHTFLFFFIYKNEATRTPTIDFGDQHTYQLYYTL